MQIKANIRERSHSSLVTSPATKPPEHSVGTCLLWLLTFLILEATQQARPAGVAFGPYTLPMVGSQMMLITNSEGGYNISVSLLQGKQCWQQRK